MRVSLKKRAKLIKSMRNFYGYSQAHVASILGVSRPTYIEIEQGKRDLRLSEASKLAVVFQVPIQDIVVGSLEKEIIKTFNPTT